MAKAELVFRFRALSFPFLMRRAEGLDFQVLALIVSRIRLCLFFLEP
ncbi:MAG: hypothetical protein M2R45_05034 [Verrucomicrobia subdivision 3 bacterium]|nr:hypothetical protein [Limisphaerales bacterium]MCS1417638.1 hypothetical protein [Limisphaerales bacterium]